MRKLYPEGETTVFVVVEELLTAAVVAEEETLCRPGFRCSVFVSTTTGVSDFEVSFVEDFSCVVAVELLVVEVAAVKLLLLVLEERPGFGKVTGTGATGSGTGSPVIKQRSIISSTSSLAATSLSYEKT